MIPDAYALETLTALLPEFDFTDTKKVDQQIKERRIQPASATGGVEWKISWGV
ncbi:MAG: hypothetical protein QM680_09280 [Luteolibacter sp.]